MDDDKGTPTCKTNHDENNMTPYDNVKFRRCFGNVKLSTKSDEEGTSGDEFDVIIDKIQDVNEDVFLTRECNNFDLVCHDHSQNSLPSSKSNNAQSDINQIEELLNSDLNFASATDQSDLKTSSEIKEKEMEESLESSSNDYENITSKSDCDLTNQIVPDQTDERIDSKSKNINPDPPVETTIDQEEPECYEKDQFLQDFKIVKPYGNDVFAKHPTCNNVDEFGNCINMMSCDDKGVKSDVIEERDSDESSKWDRKVEERAYNARYFYNPGNPGGDNFVEECKINIKNDLSEEDSASLITSPPNYDDDEPEAQYSNKYSRDSFLNDSFDDDESVKSNGTSKSASSTFESAMSSNDMMSPFGTPRNSLSKHSSVGTSRVVKSKMGINYAALTSENIPNTLNRISMHKAIEKHFVKSTANTDKKERDPDAPGSTPHSKVYSSNSIRKLLNLTSHKKLSNQSDLKIYDRIQPKRQKSDENQHLQKDSFKSISLKNKDKKINLKEFYSSRRNKLKRLVETEKLGSHLATFCNEGVDSSFPINQCISQNALSHMNQPSNKCLQVTTQNSKVGVSEPVIPSQPRENKSKFVSKIPRPVSRREVNHNLVNSCEGFEEGFYELNRTSSANLAIKSNRSEKSDTRSRPSDGSESSYKQSNTFKTKNEKPNYKNGSKVLVNSAQIGSLRSKYWMKENKVKLTPLGLTPVKKEVKKEEVQENDKKRVKSIVNIAVRQDSRLTYGKMVRVKTAPHNKSAMQVREKSLVREPSKPNPINAWKSNRKPSKVVSIGALEVNKVSERNLANL